jgi:hypothetical protein
MGAIIVLLVGLSLSLEARGRFFMVQLRLEPSAGGFVTLGSLRIKMRLGLGLLLMRCAPPVGYNTRVRVSPAAERIRPLNRTEKMTMTGAFRKVTPSSAAQ